MTDKSNIKTSTMWSTKPVKMKLFGAWEIDKTPPDCIPRLCSLNINRLTLTRSLRHDVTAIIVAVKMQNSKRILRSSEIPIPSHSESTSSVDIELDLSFALQYPHFIKRNCNYLQIILQRRKKYKNKAILGFKNLACGLIDMAEVLQRSTIVEKDLDLIGHVKELGKNETLARITISSLRSQPIDQDSNLRRGKVSIDRPDVYSDEDDFTSAEDGSDSETIEEGNSRDRMNHFRRKVNARKPRKLFANNDKFQTGVPSNVQQRNLKQKFISLLKKFRLPDSEAYDSEEKFQEALEKELNQEAPDMDEFFDDEEIDDLDDLSGDSGQEFDDVSISSTPKPSLRPFFSSCTLVGQDKSEEFPAFQGKKFDTDSQENSGAEQTPDTSDTSQKHANLDDSKKKLGQDKEVKRVKLFTKDKENKNVPKDKKPIGTTLSLTSSTFGKDDGNSPKEFVLEQLNKVFLSEEHTIPDEIIFINMSECLHSQLLMQVFERTHHIIGTNTMSDVKFCFNFLCSKIQKFSIVNLKTQIPIKLALIGSDAYVNSFLRFYVEFLSTKSPDWQSYLRFYIIPSIYVNSYSSSSLIHKYLASIDPLYSNYFFVNNPSKDLDSSRENSSDNTSYAHELYNKVVNYLKSAQYVLQIPIAEAMVTYKDKSIDDESSQVFIPFICDAKIGFVESIYGNHSIENEEVSFSVSPPGQSVAQSSANNDKSVTSPLSGKEQHASMSLTPPNSPSISTNQSFLQTSATKDHKDKDPLVEAIDLQIDYWTLQPKLNDVSNKKSENCKFTLKNCFRNVQISRLPMLGELSVSSLTLFYLLKEKKQKIMRLGKKKEKENESKCQVIEGIYRLVCSYKATQSPIKVFIDGVEFSGVKFFQLSTQWQTQIKSFPLVTLSTPDTLVSNSINNYKMLK